MIAVGFIIVPTIWDVCFAYILYLLFCLSFIDLIVVLVGCCVAVYLHLDLMFCSLCLLLFW